MASSIGIKIANGEFYPVIAERSAVKKRLVLTTVHDGQRSVQIDLYKSAALSMADAEYIGSLVVEQIAPKPKGEPSIELVISSDGSDELNAEAIDLDANESGERQRLSVSMQALDENRTYEVPDFELETEAVPPRGLYAASEAIRESEDRKSFPLIPVIAAIVVALLVIIALVWFVFGRGAADDRNTAKPVPTAAPEPTPAAPAASEPTPTIAETIPAPAAEPEPKPPVVEEKVPAAETPPPTEPEAPAAQVAVDRKRPRAPVKSYKVPRTIPKEGVRYKIRWGDTLWDISEAFYRNPWLYPRVARFNKIRNPDLIISGTFIRIPPKK